ncbi:hypothetical protein EI94DRAFT_1738030 [Lactarius quietus]|nr:hypothetical protein EI94DRAFT_1738030 [Lactarius quietus]
MCPRFLHGRNNRHQARGLARRLCGRNTVANTERQEDVVTLKERTVNLHASWEAIVLRPRLPDYPYMCGKGYIHSTSREGVIAQQDTVQERLVSVDKAKKSAAALQCMRRSVPYYVHNAQRLACQSRQGSSLLRPVSFSFHKGIPPAHGL